MEYGALVAGQESGFAVNAQPLLRVKAAPAAIRLAQLSVEFLIRAGFAAMFVILAYQFRWEWLRFVASEAILRISAFLGMATTRVSFDTILIQGQIFQFLIACTFVDVTLASIPLLWNFKKPLLKNVSWLMAAAVLLFGFNIARLEIGQVLYAHGVSWTLAHEVLGGFSYFAVWVLIWRQRSWELTRPFEV